jgi:O-antigen/teichoic acid export membrane protein
MAGQSFLRHALIYGLGSVLVQAASFFLLPIYTRCLTPAEYGTLEVLNRFAECVLVFLLFGGIRQAALAFHGQSTDRLGQDRVIGSTTLLVLVTALAGGCLMMALCGPLSRALAVGNVGLLRLAVWAMILDGLNFVLLVGPQARQQSLFFVAITATQFLLRIACSLVFVVGLGWGVAGVLWASVIAGGLHAAILAIKQFPVGRAGVDGKTLRGLSRFAAVFLPSGLAFFVLNHGDRFILREYGSLEAVGTYALGYKLALGVVFFCRASLGTVWNTRLYEAARQTDAAGLFGRVFTRSLAAYLWGSLGLCLFQEEVVLLVAGPAYQAAADVIAPVALAYFFLLAADLMDGAFYIIGRPELKTLTALISLLVTCLLYFGLIPCWGSLGAAYATLAGFLFHAGLTLLMSQRVFPVHHETRRLASMLALAAVTWAISRSLPAAPWAMVLKGLVWLLLPGILWITDLLSEDEKRWVMSRSQRTLHGVTRIMKPNVEPTVAGAETVHQPGA